jgi:hypothetical protein
MRFWTELAFIMTTTSRWRKWSRRFRTSREGVPAMSAETYGEEKEVVFCRPDNCSLTNSYDDNNSSLISE